jgi:PAS domain S-box-containing protein
VTLARIGTAWRTRLAWRLALSFFVPAVTVATLAAVISFAEVRRVLRESAFDRLHAVAAVREAQLDRWVDEQSNDMRFLASIPAIRSEAAALETGGRGAHAATLNAILRRSVETQRDFNRVVLLSASDGRVLAASDSVADRDQRRPARVFVDGRTRLVVQSVHPSPFTGRPAVTIALPVQSPTGGVVAVLAGDANLDGVQAVIADRSGLGETGEAYLIDRSYGFVRGAGDDARYPHGVHTPTIDAAVRGDSGSGVYLNQAGREVVGVHRWMPREELALFAEMDTEEAFAPARRLAWLVLATGLLAALALAGGLSLVARQIAQPILEIADAATAVAAGDLAATAPVHTRDEIGRLAIAFNVMTGRLRMLYGELQAQLSATEQAAQATEESRRLLRAVIDHLPALVAVKDLEGRYLMVNEHFVGLNRISRELTLGRSPDEVMSAARAGRVAGADAAVLSSGAPSITEEVHSIAGDDRTYLTSRFPLIDPDGRVFALAVVATDITERRRLESQLLHQQKLEAVGRLAGGVAHDINNLLTAVRCNAELLLDELDANDPSRVHLEEIDRSVRNGASLTRQLLTFSRTHVVRPSALDLNRILAGMAAMLRRYVGAEIDLRFELAADLWLVHADEGQMEQVLLNLLSNAHDAMPDGGVASVATDNVRIGAGGLTVASLPPGDYLRLSVRDTGSGIDAAILPLLFEPFFTTKEAGRGTGLGLSTAYAIVQQARGAITVDTEPGRGTTFGVYLPRFHDELVGPPPARALSDPRKAGGDTLLIVDDEKDVRSSLRRMLVRLGYQILDAESGHDALAQFERHRDRIDLVLTDIFMPGMGGSELAVELQARAPELPIIFMSGYTADEVVRDGLMDSATHFLQKPFERHTLVALIEDLLAKSTDG